VDFLERLYTDGVSLAGKAIDAKAAHDLAGASNEPPPLSVDEYGRPFLRGTASAPGGIDPRMVLLIVGAIAIVGVGFLVARGK